MYPWTTSMTVAVMFYGLIVILFTRHGKRTGREALFDYPDLAVKITAALFVAYLIYASQAGGIQFNAALKVFIWLAVPSCLLWRARDIGNKMTRWDVLAIAALWLPFDLHWVSKRSNAIKDALDWPILAVSAVILGLIFWVCLRRLHGTKCCFSFKQAIFFWSWQH